jgi:hypothetical protein
MNIQNTLKDNAPSILLALGLGGFFSAVFYTAHVAPKARDILSDLPAETSKLDQARSIIPTYAPVAGLLIASTGAVLASNRIMRNRYAALMVLYSFTDQMANRWKDAAQEEVSKKSFQKIKERVVGSDKPMPEEVRNSGASTILFDKYSDRWFTANSVESVRQAMNDVNATIFREDFAPLNDFYFAIGLNSIDYGNEVGWHVDDSPIEIQLIPIIEHEPEPVPYIAISFSVKPRH